MKFEKGKYFLAMVFGMFLLCSQPALAIDPPTNILGDVVASGSSEMKVAFNRWISISGKTFPVIDGAGLRSGNGMMSLIFRDAVRMEVGKNSEIAVSGSRGNYSIDVTKGQIAFSVPKGVSFSVKTPTSTIQTKASTGLIQNVSFASQDDIRGVVTYDGKGTRVTSINGTLVIKSGLGVHLQTVSSGNSIYVEGKDSGRVRTVQTFPEESPAGGQGGGQRDTGGALWVGAGGTAAVVGGYFIVHSISAFR